MRRPIEKLWRGFLALVLAALLFFFLYQLYSAWRFHSVLRPGVIDLLRLGDWVSLDLHPFAFWCIVTLYFLGVVTFLAFAMFERSVNRRLRRRETRSPVENVIRQSTSER